MNLLRVIINLISNGTCHLLWNGEAMNTIKPTRGLRQGDPLSPYIFVLCVERLGHWIDQKVREGKWKALKASRSGPKVSHIFLANDLMLYSEASEEQVVCVKEILNIFCKSLGQQVNFNKSLMFVSPNVSEQVALSLSENLGVLLTKELGKYLGHQLIQRGNHRGAHNDPLQRIRSQLEGCKLKCL